MDGKVNQKASDLRFKTAWRLPFPNRRLCMTNREIGKELERLVRVERRITNEILRILNLAHEQRSYLELGFSSMFDWLTRGFGYSNGAAYRRIEAARLLKSVPAASEKLADGRVNLTTLSRAQAAIKTQEKRMGVRLSSKAKSEIIQSLEYKSSEQTEKILVSLLPDSGARVSKERRRVIDECTTRYMLNFTNEMVADLDRAKEVLFHVLPEGSAAEVLAHALRFLLEKKDPLRKTTSAAEATRVTKAGMRRAIFQSSDGGCSYRDPVTGHVCGSRFQIEIDHILPQALGGKDAADNLRTLCRKHNIMMAERSFGRDFMNKFRRSQERSTE